ncbi:MAG: FAD-binding oxidoreductase [Halioglobus sp.]|nr:FAD-binding oxidoreductase [Halioglobus sp.]
MAGALTALSWGRLPLAGPARIEEEDWRFRPLPDCGAGETLLAEGARRSYGDSCINSGGIQLGTRRLNRFVDFDANTGVLQCEAGLRLDEILDLIVPRGWLLPVMPGTRYVTVGGAIANDIHGKNHHTAGSFGCHVLSLDLLRSDGARYHCSEEETRGCSRPP